MHGERGQITHWDHVDSWFPEDEGLLDARLAADHLGCEPVGPETGTALRFLATTLCARAVVEIGTGTGVSGLCLLRGMAPDGVLTSIDVEPEHLRSARAAFLAEGFPPGRLRLINGMALDVLPRLADGAYDLVFVDASAVEYPRYLVEAIRLLRPGGVVALAGALTVPPPRPGARQDPEYQAMREVLRAVFEDDRLIPLPLPLDDGPLLAAKSLC